MQIVDSHCHINFDALSGDLPGLLARAAENQVAYMLCVAVNMEDYPQIEQLAAANRHIFASVGVHPNATDCHEPEADELAAKARDAKVVAVGETGLDYFRVQAGDLSAHQARQKARFARHINAANLVGKPLIIHTRAAADDTMQMLESDAECGGVMHCFSEDWRTAKRALDLGFYISFSGIVTFKNAEALREVARKTPVERMLVETDAPYLAPEPHRGKTNEPALVRHTLEFLAELKRLPAAALARATTDNFFNLFAAAAR